MQVREHTESTLRQYALADTAIALGWAPRDVEVIDRDLGLSGTSAAHRQGFRDLMSRVCLGEAGAVFGLEISRLGRSNADLARLAEMARLTDTLPIDSDGVYDLSDFNDWLVLGLKSTMSQAELHIMAGRLQAARRAAAERGELRAPLPVGLACDADGTVVTDPDAEVRAAVADIFASHTAAGARPAREGTALCQGIIICGGCGGPMAANYHGDDRASYQCHSHRDGKKTPGCRSIMAHAVDDAVAAALLDALTPEQVGLALAAAGEVTSRHQRASRAAGLAVERARYEADPAERAFSQVEPENRLVAPNLEARWEAKLAALADARQAPQAAPDALPPLPDRASLEKLAARP